MKSFYIYLIEINSFKYAGNRHDNNQKMVKAITFSFHLEP